MGHRAESQRHMEAGYVIPTWQMLLAVLVAIGVFEYAACMEDEGADLDDELDWEL